MGVVHGLLRLRLPGRVSGRVIREQADDLHLGEVLERRLFEAGQFASNDEMEQLLRGTVRHDLFPNAVPGEQDLRHTSTGAQGNG